MTVRRLIPLLLWPALAIPQVPIPKKRPQPPADLVCQDLFAATCDAPDGSAKYEGSFKASTEAGFSKVKAARDKAAKEMGYKDFDDAVKTRLSKKGIDIKASPDEDAFTRLKREMDRPKYGDGRRLYESVDRCYQKVDRLKEIPFQSLNFQQMQALAEEYKAFHFEYDQLRINPYVQDIPNFVNAHIGDKCDLLKSSPDFFNEKDNKKVSQTCKRMNQIHRQAADLFRLEGTEKYQEQATKFVEANMLPEPVDSKIVNANKNPFLGVEANETIRQIQQNEYYAQRVCEQYEVAMESAGNKAFEEVALEINTSKTNVEAVLGSFYSPKNKTKLNESVAASKAQIKSIVQQYVKDPKKRAQILERYDQIQTVWIDSPDGSKYSKTGNGTLSLDSSKALKDSSDPTQLDIHSVFNDPSLSYFSTYNAEYTPDKSVGVFSSTQKINMYPVFLDKLDSESEAFDVIVAHELAHMIDPESSVLSDFDLSAEYQPLIACYKKSDSINLGNNQSGEAISDYIASEVLARKASALPVEKRKDLVMKSMQVFCEFEDGNTNFHASHSGPHPLNVHRASGIFGANPNLRKVLGCEGPSSKYATCGLEVELPGTEPANRSRNNSSQNKGFIQ